MKTINLLLLTIIFLILIVGTILFIIPSTKDDEDKIIFNEKMKINEMKILEVGEKFKEEPFIDREPGRRERIVFWEHYDKVEEARERTIKGS